MWTQKVSAIKLILLNDISLTSKWIFIKVQTNFKKMIIYLEIDSSLVPSTKADCSTFSSCISCVSSRSQCSWCTAADLCTSNANNTCPNDMLVTSVIVSAGNQNNDLDLILERYLNNNPNSWLKWLDFSTQLNKQKKLRNFYT